MADLELKPCAFCGGEAQILLKSETTLFGEESFAIVFCTSCEIRTPKFYYCPERGERSIVAETAAAKHWNRRVDNG